MHRALAPPARAAARAAARGGPWSARPQGQRPARSSDRKPPPPPPPISSRANRPPKAIRGAASGRVHYKIGVFCCWAGWERLVTKKRRHQPPSATTRPRTKKALAPTRPPLLALGGGLLRDDGRGSPSICEVVVVCGLRCGRAVGPAVGRTMGRLWRLPSLPLGRGVRVLDARRSPSATPPKHLRSRTAERGGGCLGCSGSSLV